MRATIRDVATRAGVAVGTVSRVLNDSPGVRGATRARVQAAIAELDYRPDLRARALSTGRTRHVGAIVPFFTVPSAVDRLRGLSDALEAADHDLVLFNVSTPAQRAERFGTLGGQLHVDGVVVVSLQPTDEEASRFAASRAPIVLVDCEHAELDHVVIDDVEGGRMAARHLLDLGHRELAFVGDRDDDEHRFVSMARRLRGFSEELARAGVLLADGRVRRGVHHQETGRRHGRELLQSDRPPTAIFAASDVQALGVLDAAAELGVGVPEQLSVLGFDDLEIARYAGLSTIRQPLYESGHMGGRMLLEALACPERDGPRQARELALSLIPRRTTRSL